MVTKIENEDKPILRLHVKFENDRSMHARTLAQNVRARGLTKTMGTDTSGFSPLVSMGTLFVPIVFVSPHCQIRI